MSIWDDDDIKMGDGEYMHFEVVGDRLRGRITAIRKHSFADGNVVPQLTVETDHGVRIYSVGQLKVKKWLVEVRPEVGDLIDIELIQLEPRGGRKVLKHFKTKIEKGDEKPPF